MTLRENDFITSVEIDGRDLGRFDQWSGGNVTAPDDKYRGADGIERPLGGQRSVENVTVSRDYRPGREDDGIEHWLIHRVGRGQARASRRRKDANGQPFGRPVILTGLLTSFNMPDTNSGESGAALFELELALSSEVA